LSRKHPEIFGDDRFCQDFSKQHLT